MTNTNTSPQKDFTLFLIILSGICGGSVYPLIKIAEQYAIPKFAYIFWESLFVVLFLIGLSLVKKKGELFRFKEIKYYLFCAFTNIIIPQSLFFIIAPNLDASIMGLIIVLTPLFVYLGSLGLKDIKFNIIKFMGVAIGLLGAIILFIPDLMNLNNNFHWLWVFIAFSLPITYAFNRIFVTKLKPKDSESAHTRLAIGLFGCVAFIMGITMMISGQIYIPFSFVTYGDMALVGHAVVMVIFYMTFFVLAKKGALQNALGSYVVPVVTLTWGIILFDEMISMFYPVAFILIAIGLYLTNRKSIK